MPKRSNYEPIRGNEDDGHRRSSPSISPRRLVMAGVAIFATIVVGDRLLTSSNSNHNLNYDANDNGSSSLPLLSRGNKHDHHRPHDHSDNHHHHHHDSRDEVHRLLHDLDKEMKGRVIFRQGHDFAKASKVWNECTATAISFAIIEPANEHDVQLAIPILTQLSTEPHNIPFRIKSGGHSYTGWSTVDQGIILSLTKLNYVDLDTETGIATLGPAATVENVLYTALPKGYGGVVGFCPGVAEGGYALGGGVGVQSRLYGLGLDSIISARMVKADGSVVVASNTEGGDSDLFFALRGAGQNNFGVVTEMEYQLHPMIQNHGDDLLVLQGMIPVEIIPEVNVKLAETNLPGNWFPIYEGGLEANGPKALPMAFHYTGDMYDGKEFAKNTILPIFPDDVASELEMDTLDWYEWTIANGNVEGNYVRAWNGFLLEGKVLADTWTKIMKLVVEVLEISPYIIIDTELWGGAISTPPNNATAFPYRDAAWNVGFALLVPVEDGRDVFDDIVSKVDAIWPSISNYLDGAYVNYQMESLLKEEYPTIYWGSNLERLMELKRKYDPDNVFNSPQSIPAQ